MMARNTIAWKDGFENRFSLSTAKSEIRAVYALREAYFKTFIIFKEDIQIFS